MCHALAGHRLTRVRRACARVLGLAGDTEHVPVVIRLRSDPVASVRDAAHRAGQRLQTRLDIALDRWSAD